MIIELWTDGSGTSDGPIGWAWLLRAISEDGELIDEKRGSGAHPNGTNNRAELLAVIDGLQQLTRQAELTVYTDSAYVANAFARGWVGNWSRNGWQRSPTPDEKRRSACAQCPLCAHPAMLPGEECLRHDEPVKKDAPFNDRSIANRDLWQQLLSASEIHRLEFRHVEGHSGIAPNDDCDARAKAARQAMIAKLEAGQDDAA